MKYCETFAALLDPFVDGELSPEEMTRVQAHLDECPACRAYVDDALAIRAAFPDADDMELPENFAETVMARIQAEAAPRAEAAAQKRKSRPWVKALASLAACCAIVLLAGPLLFSNHAKMEAASTSAAAAPAERAMESSVEETTEEAAPAEAEAPAAEAYDIAEPEETGGTEPAAPAPASVTAAKPEEAPSKSDAPAAFQTADGGGIISTLTLPPEAASLLAGFTPVEETDTQARYELTRQDCDVLRSALDRAGIAFTLDDAGSDTVLVILEK